MATLPPTDAKLIRNRYYSADGTFIGTVCVVHGGYTPADHLTRSRRESSGYTRTCRPCQAAASRATLPDRRQRLRERTDAEVVADWDRLRGPGGLKRCRLCRVDKPMGGYPRNRTAPDGTGFDCKSCLAAEARRRRSSRP